MPEDPSSGSVSASDLDFSNLSLDSGMDRLTRLADSLVEGVTPTSPPAQGANPTSNISAASQHVPAGRSGLAAGVTPSPRQKMAASVGRPEPRGDSWYRQGGDPYLEAPLQHSGASKTHTQRATSVSSSESARLQSRTDNQTHSHMDMQAGSAPQSDSDSRTHRQTPQMIASQAASVAPGSDRAESGHLSAAVSHHISAPADTASLCQHSLPSHQWMGSRSQHSSAAESTLSRPTSRASTSHAAKDGATGFAKQARAVQSAERARLSQDARGATQLPQQAGAVWTPDQARLYQTTPVDTASEGRSMTAQVHQSSAHGLSDRDAGASEAETSLAEAQQTESCHRRGGSDAELASCGDGPGCGGNLVEEAGSDVLQHQQREGLLSDSEEESESEFESSLVAARRLRPTNMTQAATW